MHRSLLKRRVFREKKHRGLDDVVGTFAKCICLPADRLVVWAGGHVVEQEDTWNKIIKDFSAANRY